MERIMKLIVVVFISLIAFQTFAQIGNISDVSLAGKPLMVDANPRFSGSPHLESRWNVGNIIMNNEHVYGGVQVRYNVYDDVPEFNKEGQAFALDPLKVREFNYVSNSADGAKTYSFKNGFTDIPGFSAKNYFEVLYGGKIYLLKKHSKQLINDPSATYGSVASQVIQDRNALYFRLSDGKAGTLKANKKTVLSLFPGKESAIDSFVKANKLTYKFDTDLAKIFAHADSL
jgi:hypothetical protein